MKTRIQIQIVELPDVIAVSCPYNKNNNKVFRNLGGEFDRETSRWLLPRTAVTSDKLAELFGADSGLVTVVVTEAEYSEAENQLQLGGYVLATRLQRDHAVQTPIGVQLQSGSWADRGGSVNHPEVNGTNIVLQVVVRRAFAETHGLNVVVEHDDPLPNPMETYADRDLVSELENRGYKVSK